MFAFFLKKMDTWMLLYGITMHTMESSPKEMKTSSPAESCAVQIILPENFCKVFEAIKWILRILGRKKNSLNFKKAF